MLHKLKYLLIPILALAWLSGCNAGLSRSRARSLIAETSAFKEKVTIKLTTIGTTELTPDVVSLEKLGIVKVVDKRECMFTGPCGKVTLTEKGVEASRGWETFKIDDFYGREYVGYRIPVASKVGIEIAGIKEEPLVGTVAEFKWKCQLSDLGQKMQPDVSKECPPGNSSKQSAAVFKRYDDGWRIERISW